MLQIYYDQKTGNIEQDKSLQAFKNRLSDENKTVTKNLNACLRDEIKSVRQI